MSPPGLYAIQTALRKVRALSCRRRGSLERLTALCQRVAHGGPGPLRATRVVALQGPDHPQDASIRRVRPSRRPSASAARSASGDRVLVSGHGADLAGRNGRPRPLRPGETVLRDHRRGPRAKRARRLDAGRKDADLPRPTPPSRMRSARPIAKRWRRHAPAATMVVVKSACSTSAGRSRSKPRRNS